ncbi:MAG: 2-oxoglutarate dehydrogenase E1 component [Ectothiorhodospiraceae bacterium]|nr:2-oxoglutarate dehydrogenase E1 component [Ectothiorhodospiraceae bacterium]
MSVSSALNAANAAFLEDLYTRYLEDRASVPAEWAATFDHLGEAVAPRAAADGSAVYLPEMADAQAKVLQLISAIRYRGHREAAVDPLQLYEHPRVPDLHLDFYGLGEADLGRRFNTGSLFTDTEAALGDILTLLRDTYCGSIGTELTHITSTEQKRWVQERLERSRGRPAFDTDKKRDILRWVTSGRKLEDYLHRKYVGQKRFSLEGGENLIPLLDELVQRAGGEGVKEIVIGMAHRGRLNVLVNILGKHPRVLFGEFEGKIDVGKGSGDVKYHLGFSSDVQTPGGPVHLVLAFNPSHLEIINPVVEGSVRARQERRRDKEGNQVVPILVHGDAAFAGQGVVTETLNLSETRGYGTGGTVHVVVNNQIGFTTSDPRDSRSTLYCTDVAKLVQAPIFHVNGNDAEAVVYVAQLALDFRMQFKKDVVIDLVCFRRWGHNEADEPFATQPIMYSRIREQKGPRRVYAERLIEEGVIAPGDDETLSGRYFEALEADEVVSRPVVRSNEATTLIDWSPYLDGTWRSPCDTAIDADRFERLGLKLCEYPEDFELHRAVQRVVDARREMARGERPMDWGFAECLAYATLAEDGYSVRISGQDSQRGTFFHRHAVLHNQKRRGTYTPLMHLFKGQPRVRIINSLLSEEAVLAFEYGYSTAEPNALVIWEAQFGDFANGAQVVIDQFLSSSEAKWGRFCGLVMFLPHGYDGQGPEHSSARLERFLQLCAEDNIQVCVPSTPAQMFHMLRRQMLRPVRKPLVVMTPKSLLRHRLSVSTRDDLARSGFQLVIDEADPIDPQAVTRLVLCTGKVYFDLLEKRREHQLERVAIARVEQLYPFPREEIEALLARYPNANEVVWAQEEPRNQGSWFFMLSRRHLAGCIDKRHTLSYAGRDYSASPAVGYLNVHLEEQRALVEAALGLDQAEARKRRSA